MPKRNLIINYNRPEGDYVKEVNGVTYDWEFYCWDDKGTDLIVAGAHQFDQFSGQGVAIIEIDDRLENIGFIVKQSENPGNQWFKKDIEINRVIKIPKDYQGDTVTVIIDQGEKLFSYKEEQLNVREIENVQLKLPEGSLELAKTLSVKFNNKISQEFLEKFKKEVGVTESLKTQIGQTEAVGDEAKQIKIIDVNIDEKNPTIINIELEKELTPFDKKYNVLFEDKTFHLSLKGLYDTKEFENKLTYNGELGAQYSKDETTFTVWAPNADKVSVTLYGKNGDEDQKSNDKTVVNTPMLRAEGGTWNVSISGDLHGTFYKYTAMIEGNEVCVPDPYGKTTGINGKRSMVIDMSKTNPEGWEDFKLKGVPNSDKKNLAVYELNVRDYTKDESSGVKEEHRGKFLGLIQKGTQTEEHNATGFDHITQEVKPEYIQLMPILDYGSVDEHNPVQNWGYDPISWMSLEGSYSTNPYSGEVGIRELKQLMLAYGKEGIGVILDFVVTHTYNGDKFAQEQLCPEYYYRKWPNGDLSNGVGCGNELKSERIMVRKHILDAMQYLTKEFKFKGFRLDAMYLFDIDTTKLMYQKLSIIDPNIQLFGEGWAPCSPSSLSEEKRSTLENLSEQKVKGIGAFDLDAQMALKGSIDFHDKDYDSGTKRGFGTGDSDESRKSEIMHAIVGRINHNQLRAIGRLEQLSKKCVSSPNLDVNFVDCHDFYALVDKIKMSTFDIYSEAQRHEIYRSMLSWTFSSQGIAFFTEGTEFRRGKEHPIQDIKGDDVDEMRMLDEDLVSKLDQKAEDLNQIILNKDRLKVYYKKKYDDNAYISGDKVNAINWKNKDECVRSGEYGFNIGLLDIRRNHPAFRMVTAEEINDKLSFYEISNPNVIGYSISGKANGDSCEQFMVCYNGGNSFIEVQLDKDKKWAVLVDSFNQIASDKINQIVSEKLTIEPFSSIILADLESMEVYLKSKEQVKEQIEHPQDMAPKIEKNMDKAMDPQNMFIMKYTGKPNSDLVSGMGFNTMLK